LTTTQRTMERLSQGHHGNGARDVSSVTPAPARSQAWAVNEAPASCCLKFKLDGIEIMYTLRDVDDRALFPRVKQMLARLQDKIGQTNPEPSSPETPDTELEHSPGWCTRHEVQMSRCHNATGCWWSHQLGDGTWCKGK
jgi:hypothetical protein